MRSQNQNKITLEAGRIKRIHVNKHVIAGNRKHGRNEAPLTCKIGNENIRGHRIAIEGPSSVVYSPDKPLKCGAKVWIETKARVNIS